MIQLIVYTGFYWAVKVMEELLVVTALSPSPWISTLRGLQRWRGTPGRRLLMFTIPSHAEFSALRKSTRCFALGSVTTWGMPLVTRLEESVWVGGGGGGEGRSQRVKADMQILHELVRRQEVGERNLSYMYRAQPFSFMWNKVVYLLELFLPLS